MKKMYLITVSLIIFITLVFLFFHSDINQKNKAFLKNYDIEIDLKKSFYEELTIPYEFDDMFEEYCDLQKKAGFDLSLYKGKTAIRYTYQITNFPFKDQEPVFVNLILFNNAPIGGDIISPKLNGFIEPLNYISESKNHQNIDTQ